jgi:hypothetical protein
MKLVSVTGYTANLSPILRMVPPSGRSIDGAREDSLLSLRLEPRSVFSDPLGFIRYSSPVCHAARIEHEYTHSTAWAYLAALDVLRAKLFGRCKLSIGIEPFHRLVTQVMA